MPGNPFLPSSFAFRDVNARCISFTSRRIFACVRQLFALKPPRYEQNPRFIHVARRGREEGSRGGVARRGREEGTRRRHEGGTKELPPQEGVADARRSNPHTQPDVTLSSDRERASLLPALQIQIRQRVPVEDGVLAGAFLLAVVFEEAEGVFAQADDSIEVTGRQESHA